MLLESVRAAPFFSLCADEAADASNKRQMPLIIRHVDRQGYVRKDFFKFVLCDTRTNGHALAEKLTNKVTELGQVLSKLRGQSYDLAVNVGGCLDGTAAVIFRSHPKAIYVHCSSHVLNLAIVSCLNVQQVKNMWCVLKEVGLFFSNSTKRQSALEVHIDTLHFVSSNRRKLIDPCRTRWMARPSALVAFADLYVPVVAALEEVSQCRHWSLDSAGAASTLLSPITQFSFICASCISKQVLEYVHDLTTSLQKTSKDICNAYQEVKTVTETLHRVREDIDIYRGQWYRLAVSMAEKVGVDAFIPKICCRRTNRQNTPAATP